MKINDGKLVGVGTALAAAVALSFSSVPTLSFADDSPAGDQVNCYGVNACKGKTACKTAKNACKGQNSCKGQGTTLESADQCKKDGGTVQAPTS